MQTFKLTSLPIEQIGDLDGFEWKLGQFFAARTYPVRLVATSRPFAMDAPIRALQREQHDLRRLARAASNTPYSGQGDRCRSLSVARAKVSTCQWAPGSHA